jgi:hypothetical protein
MQHHLLEVNFKKPDGDEPHGRTFEYMQDIMNKAFPELHLTVSELCQLRNHDSKDHFFKFADDTFLHTIRRPPAASEASSTISF